MFFIVGISTQKTKNSFEDPRFCLDALKPIQRSDCSRRLENQPLKPFFFIFYSTGKVKTECSVFYQAMALLKVHGRSLFLG
ncbi:hypothetical protein AYB33_12965 [Leptospira santarosai]|nr:hypothetical protein AYB33_12965 [Leptospira santarosai]